MHRRSSWASGTATELGNPARVRGRPFVGRDCGCLRRRSSQLFGSYSRRLLPRLRRWRASHTRKYGGGRYKSRVSKVSHRKQWSSDTGSRRMYKCARKRNTKWIVWCNRDADIRTAKSEQVRAKAGDRRACLSLPYDGRDRSVV